MRISDWSSDVCSSDLFKHGETLFLMGDDAGGSSKDGRRATIASKYCVIILGGDQLGDFSQQFNARDLPAAQRMALATSAGETAPRDRPEKSRGGKGWVRTWRIRWAPEH